MNWHDYFTYDAETGNLIWRERNRTDFVRTYMWDRFVSRQQGKIAGYRNYRPSGKPRCIDISINSRPQKAHRIIWEMHYGPIPDGMLIDHIDGDPFNNKLNNLRLATNAQNQYNTGKSIINTSGYKGVCFHKRSGKWMSQIKFNGTSKYIGLFRTPEEAHEAYCFISKLLHGPFAKLQ